jgi:hypothetical protein
MARMNTKSTWAAGGTVFAACMLVMVGVWQLLVGIAALAEDEIFVTTPNYLYQFDLTGWGTAHVIIGALVALVGVFVFMGRRWAYWTGIGLAIVSATTQFFWMPWQPLWSMIMIGVDVFAIWALATAARSTPMAEISDEEYAGRTTGSWSNLNTQTTSTATNPAKERDDMQTRTGTESPAPARSEQRPPEAH